jgi:hypothetical protein
MVGIDDMEEEDKLELRARYLKVPFLITLDTHTWEWRIFRWTGAIAFVGFCGLLKVSRFIKTLLGRGNIDFHGAVKPLIYGWEEWKRTLGHSEGYIVVRNDTGDTIDVFVHRVMPMRQVVKMCAEAAVKVGGVTEVPLKLGLDFSQHTDKVQYTPAVQAGGKAWAYVGYFSGGAHITARPQGSETHVFCENEKVPAGKLVSIQPGPGASDTFKPVVKVDQLHPPGIGVNAGLIGALVSVVLAMMPFVSRHGPKHRNPTLLGGLSRRTSPNAVKGRWLSPAYRMIHSGISVRVRHIGCTPV